eukprot:m.135440 g.135440  ORF g.135440 m.135440 type:complete len:69 (-) comp10010_c0_seq1:198-404(-)
MTPTHCTWVYTTVRRELLAPAKQAAPMQKQYKTGQAIQRIRTPTEIPTASAITCLAALKSQQRVHKVP